MDPAGFHHTIRCPFGKGSYTWHGNKNSFIDVEDFPLDLNQSVDLEVPSFLSTDYTVEFAARELPFEFPVHLRYPHSGNAEPPRRVSLGRLCSGAECREYFALVPIPDKDHFVPVTVSTLSALWLSAIFLCWLIIRKTRKK